MRVFDGCTPADVVIGTFRTSHDAQPTSAMLNKTDIKERATVDPLRVLRSLSGPLENIDTATASLAAAVAFSPRFLKSVGRCRSE